MDNKDIQKNNYSQNLKDSVLERLESTHIEPHSRWYWLFREYSVWSIWVASVFLGAVSVAVIHFASVHTGYALYEATHDSFITFAIETLPYLWLIAFLLLSVVAYVNIRHTKRGYKYPFSHVVLSSLGFSLIGGVLLNMAGVGFYLDTYLGRLSDMYESHEEMEIRMWQKPDAGRLIGTYASEIFTDVDGNVWELDLSELRPRDASLLNSIDDDKIRLLGMRDSSKEDLFHACGVFPLMLRQPPTIDDLKEERKEFVEFIKVELKDRDDNLEIRDSDVKTPNAPTGAYCREMPLLNRVQPKPGVPN